MGRSKPNPDLLKPREYQRLARCLWEAKLQPSDLLQSDASEYLTLCQAVVDKERLQRLLARGFLLGQVLERWQARSIWVISRADALYPSRFKTRLRDESPALLYGCGDINLIDKGVWLSSGLVILMMYFSLILVRLVNYQLKQAEQLFQAGPKVSTKQLCKVP